MTLLRKKMQLNEQVLGQHEESSQELIIDASVIRYVSKFRQKTPWSKEAGGQLFGSIGRDRVFVCEVAGPYIGDERSRYRYRSNPTAAQGVIEEKSKRGLLYLGEWHTHAEDYPTASVLDKEGMHRLMENSRLNSDALLLLIVGRACDIDGLAVMSFSNSVVSHWRLKRLAG